MTAVLDPGALLNAGPGHTIGQFFGVGGLDVASRHHRGRAGRWSTSPGLRYPAGGTFLDRACAVEWDTAAPAEHLGFLAVPHYVKPSGTARTGPNGEPLTGSWLPVAGPLDAYGLGQPAMVEDNDRAPYQAPKRSSHVPTVLAVVVLAGLVVAACYVTDGGGF